MGIILKWFTNKKDGRAWSVMTLKHFGGNLKESVI